MPPVSYHLTLSEAVVYRRIVTHDELAALLATDLSEATTEELTRLVSESLAVAELLHHFGTVEHEHWSVQPTGAAAPPRPDTDPNGTEPSAEAGATHDYPTVDVLGRHLDSAHVLVGDSGGLSAVYEAEPSDAMPGLMCVETEHGPLYLDPDHPYPVLADT